ncbi:hypothetical protein GJW-30_1_01024 [Variibacter gotjawalensis]|uniref:Uncharacterized protein n=1 Tax=Variibacter gotjawalensis TaxID=1333996 RepID=A0A0S3PRB1_9BRAD|nr:hypothetical protein [Variibacter gotjawalensis]NIK48804.1 hypothetical protein [Variibacter gotjawalensis]RZS50665.1 hypothetical protein EV661_3132 [Variibacter gotjawalensis]BAT58498.1 hypothetical protein GJW-30_1_01024 [Variibacter gotjawalensis]
MKLLAAIALTIALLSSPGRAEEPRVGEEAATSDFWSRELEAMKMTPMPPGERWWEVVEKELGCPTVEDGCRKCTSGDCSPVPIACTPAPWKCVAP